MKKIIILSAVLVGLAGCSSSDDAPPSVSGTVTAAELVGTWLRACEADASLGGSFDLMLTLTATDGIVNINMYNDATCSPLAQFGMDIETFTYTLGADFALDGTVAGIITGTELDSTDTLLGSPDFGVITYDSIALVGTSLYVGDDEADPLKDASTPAARPTKLDALPFVKQ